LEKDVQVEAEEFEGVVETSRVQRLSASDDRTVVGIDRAVAVDVAEARVARLHARTAGAVVGNVGFEDPFAVDVVEVVVFVSPFVDIAVKHAHRLADFGDIGVVVGDDIDDALLIVRQCQHLVAVEGDVEIGRPAEVFRVEILGLEREFPSLIPDFSDIHGVGGEARRGWDVGGQQQVGGNLAVPVHGDRKPVAEQPQIDSRIPLRGGFPFEVPVAQIDDDVARGVAVVERVLRPLRGVHLRPVCVFRNAVVARLSPAGPEFQVGDDLVLTEELFVGDVPCGRGRREVTPAVVLGELRRAVGAERRREVVPVVVVVVDARQERHQRPFRRIVGRNHRGAFAESVDAQMLVGNMRGLHVGIPVAAALHGLSQENVEFVLFVLVEGGLVGQGVLVDPLLGRFVLHRCVDSVRAVFVTRARTRTVELLVRIIVRQESAHNLYFQVFDDFVFDIGIGPEIVVDAFAVFVRNDVDRIYPEVL